MTTEISYKKNSDAIDTYVFAIGDVWRKATESIIETGKKLNEAESDLSRSQWKELKDRLRKQNIMGDATISKLKTISRNNILADESNIKHLPPSYATLYVIAKGDDDVVQKAIDEGTINTNTQLKDLAAIIPYTPKNQTKQKAITRTIRVIITGDDIPKELEHELNQVLGLFKQNGFTVKL
jgi:hypothetical protein